MIKWTPKNTVGGKACEACHGPRLQACRAGVADHPSKVSPKRTDEDSLKCHFNRRTQIVDPRLAREKLSAVYGVPLGAQGIQPSLPVEEPGSESDVRGLP